MENNNKLEKLKSVLELMQNDTVTPAKLAQFVTTIVKIVKDSKDSMENTSQEVKDYLSKAIEYLDTEHSKLLEKVNTETTTLDTKLTKKLDKSISDMKMMCEEMMMSKPQDGYTPVKGVDYFDGEDGKDAENVTPKDIKDKLETLKGEERLDSSAIKGLDTLEKGITDRAIGILDSRTKFLVNKSVKHDATLSGSGTDADPLKVVAGSGTGIVETVVAGTGISVDSTDPANPVVTNTNPTPYALPTASDTVKGGVKIGSGLQMTGEVLSAIGGVGTDEKVKYDAGDPTAGYIADKVVAGTGISVAEGTGATENKLVITSSITQYTDELAQDAVGSILTDSTEIDFTYTDETPSITASIKNGSIDETKLDTSTNASLVLANKSINRFNGACQVPTITDNGNGTVTITSGDYCLSADSSGSGAITTYTIAGLTNQALTDLTMNYIVANYNGGTPQLQVITDVSLINETTIVPVYSIFRNGNILHTQNWDALGLALANKVHQSIVKTQRYRRESGLTLSESGTRNLNLTLGRIWTGAVPITLDAIATLTDNLYLWYHSSGNWTSSVASQYNNTQYDNGTNLATLTANRYAVNWIFRGVESQKHLYVVLGTGDYTLAQAQEAILPAIPTAISSHAVLVGKLIVQNGSDTATTIQSAFDVQFSTATPNSHADLTNLAWGTSGHTGLANNVAGFDGTGVSTNYAIDTDLSSTSTSDDTVPSAKATKSYADTKVTANVAITGATKTKITYDAKGLVTAGVDATTADIADSTDKRYVSDAQITAFHGVNDANTTSNSYADGKVEDAIVDGVITKAPSQNAVFDALALKAPIANPSFTGVVTTAGNIELGHASDTTLSRVSAGVLAIEGNNIITSATVPVKATGAEIDTGTDDAKFATAKALTDQTVLLKKSGGTMTGAIITADHGTATNPEIVSVVYGTSTPPTANTTPIGTLFIKYTA